MELQKRVAVLEKYGLGIVALAVFAGLHATTFYNYLVFHTIVEVFAIVVACGIFMLAWNSRVVSQNRYLLFLGVAYLFVGGLDLVHTLAYEGLGIFPGPSTNLATQLWVSGRYMESFSLLLAPLLAAKRLRAGVVFACFALVTALLLLSILQWDIFPVCFDEGSGLTAFKKASEGVISALLIASVVVLWRRRRGEAGIPRFLPLDSRRKDKGGEGHRSDGADNQLPLVREKLQGVGKGIRRRDRGL